VAWTLSSDPMTQTPVPVAKPFALGGWAGETATIVSWAGWALLFATIGLVLTLRRPGNPIGWLYAAAGLVWTLPVPFDPWVDELLLSGRPLPPVARLGALAGDTLWAVGVTLAITLPLLLLPDGRLRSPRWRMVAAAAIAATAINVIGWCLSSGPMTQTPVPVAKPFALGGWAGEAAATLSWAGFALQFACIPAAALCAVLRFRSSAGVERQQMRWVAAGAISAAAAPLVLVPLEQLGILPLKDAFALPMLLSVPVAVAVAVLRYRLWDLDRLVSRTVTYAVVTALLIVPYLLVVPAASELAAGSGSLAVAGATLAVAGLFQPLRRRVQELVDRRFNRRRYDAARTVDGFAARLRDQVDLDALHGELLAVVDQTMQPTRASLWLRQAR
ncbi:MAG TPA: hypothetical protein VG411_20130, partial [Actinomycetota bacterium]|nr:hypothetical protein [Actinomycetota bacterium]